ncbi:hypothetical protein P4O66_016789, partial [Electrophorus voltai]
FYKVARPLLENFEKWEKNWALFQDSERKAADPNHFSNRGGALLKESKDRAKVQKLLPKLEEELKARVETWETEQGSTFLMKGQSVMEYISRQWEEYRSQKDKEKNEWMSKKADSTLFKRPHGPGSSGVTPNKIKKTPNQLSLRTTTMSISASSVSSTFLCVPGKPPLSAKVKPPLPSPVHSVCDPPCLVFPQRVKTLETSSVPQTPLQEFNSDKKPISFTYSDFTVEEDLTVCS